MHQHIVGALQAEVVSEKTQVILAQISGRYIHPKVVTCNRHLLFQVDVQPLRKNGEDTKKLFTYVADPGFI